MMHAGGQTGAFPHIGGLYAGCRVTHPHTHTHALYLHKTEIELLIASRHTDLKGQQRSLYRGTCLVIVTANRKTIDDLNSPKIKSHLSNCHLRKNNNDSNTSSIITFISHWYQTVNSSKPAFVCKWESVPCERQLG